MIVLVWVALSMFAKDGLGTMMTVAEAKGRAWLAGGLDSAGDLANVVCYVYGAGEIIVHGWHLRSAEILAVMMVTSLLGTTFWTYLGRRVGDGRPPPAGWWSCPWCRAVTTGPVCAQCSGPRDRHGHLGGTH